MRYPIRLQRRYRFISFIWGALDRNSYAEIKDDVLFARFGWTSFHTPLANIERWEISGPYRWYTAIGVRGTPGAGDLTFGGSTHGGVGLFFREHVRLMLFRRLRVLYVTVDDVDAFARALADRGIPGTDVRKKQL